MPLHDWKSNLAWLFHDFRSGWLQSIKHALNDGTLPPDYYALTERRTHGFELDPAPPPPGLDYEDEPVGLSIPGPSARFVQTGDRFGPRNVVRAVTVRRSADDRLVAVVDLACPESATGRVPVSVVAERVVGFVERGVHQLLANIHPLAAAGQGVHDTIWQQLGFDPAPLPADKPLTVVSYECKDVVAAYVEPVAVGDVLPDMPLFLIPGGYVIVPLEKTYMAAWEGVPRRWRKVIDPTAS